MDVFAITGTVLIGSSIAYAVYTFLRNEENVTYNSDSDKMNVYCIFSKSDQSPKQKLLQLINDSQKTLDVAIYTITEKEIISHLCYATKRGVKVRVITDREQTNKVKAQANGIQRLLNNDIPVMINNHRGIMHLKLIISDGTTVASGSYNFTNRAEKNNDEVLILINNKKMATEWSEKFEMMWKDSNNYIPYAKKAYRKHA